MVQYYCKAPLFGLPECSLYRRISWGVCKSCWRAHIQNNDKMQELYNTRWSENIRLSYNKEDNDWHSELSQRQPGEPLMQAAEPYTVKDYKACERSESESSRTTEWRRDFRIMENREIQKDVTSSPPPPPSAKRQHFRPSSGAPSQLCPVGASDIPEPEHEQPRRKEKRSDMRSRSPKPERRRAMSSRSRSSRRRTRKGLRPPGSPPPWRRWSPQPWGRCRSPPWRAGQRPQSSAEQPAQVELRRGQDGGIFSRAASTQPQPSNAVQHDQPQRSRSRAEQPTVFLTTSIEKLTEKDAEAAREHMRRMIFFASLAAKQQRTGPNNAWTEELSPA